MSGSKMGLPPSALVHAASAPSERAVEVADLVGPHVGVHGRARRVGDVRRLRAERDAAVGEAARVDRLRACRHPRRDKEEQAQREE